MLPERLLILCDQDFQGLNSLLPILENALPKTVIQLLRLNWDETINSNSLKNLIQTIQEQACTIALILTSSDQSPYRLAYLCYLAGIPIRIGRSQEFGGGVLSHCLASSDDDVSFIQSCLDLLTPL